MEHNVLERESFYPSHIPFSPVEGWEGWKDVLENNIILWCWVQPFTFSFQPIICGIRWLQFCFKKHTGMHIHTQRVSPPFDSTCETGSINSAFHSNPQIVCISKGLSPSDAASLMRWVFMCVILCDFCVFMSVYLNRCVCVLCVKLISEARDTWQKITLLQTGL